MSLKRIVEGHDTRIGKAFDLVIQTLIVLSLASFCLETLPDLPAGVRAFLRVFEIVTVVIFTAEYLLRIVVALAILPFYVSRGLDLRAAQIRA